ncbi:hypothetical protein [Priestia endophytica]|uniref:Uncharacterized protein n=1 Tax=Priestia endophytica DSM 13796 TaxID=1121089 RepID=A0A1I6BZY4_9BACI|nr:hypothetical protein [Priestia endophytica]KYG33475.1 hypothetical protein AZF06_21770 [Priestia endophytica]SFQ86469.1 hypothetical protein SAMN02745910_04647 [Priestia endophytica DSM 13796]
MQAVFIGYDIPEALEVKWEIIMPELDKKYKRIQYEGDEVHIIAGDFTGEPDIKFIEDLVFAYNTDRQINLTLDVFELDEPSILDNDVKVLVEDIQDSSDCWETTVLGAREFLMNQWDYNDYETEEEMYRHMYEMETADYEELFERLAGIDYTMDKIEEA